jgi:hypothetical protein
LTNLKNTGTAAEFTGAAAQVAPETEMHILPPYQPPPIDPAVSTRGLAASST